MANVTYYLGAGASAGALPTYQNFGEKFNEFLIAISCEPHSVFNDVLPNVVFYNQLYEDVKKLNEELKFHSTPDTIAKKHFHHAHDLSTFKNVLILFFWYLQAGKPVDKRYDAFIASILKPVKDFKFHENFKVITWNYDLQLEFAFRNFYGGKMNEVFSKVKTFPNINSKFNSYSYNKTTLNVVHLNGIAYAYSDSYKDIFNHIINEDDFFYELLRAYKLIQDNNKLGGASYFNYAWEINDRSSFIQNLQIDVAKEIAKETEILVIIGYSFPIFNDEIDNEIISSMHKLQKVYIQDSNENLKNRLTETIFFNHVSKIQNSKIVWIKDTSAFHLPTEWNKSFN